VIVVGGGISGLQAAYKVQKEGLSSIVLEARNRVGGKLLAVEVPEQVEGGGKKGGIDLGGAWINDSNQTRAYSLAKRLGLDLIEQATDGNCIVQQSNGAVLRFPYGETPKVRSSSY
jgi:monoamine oxidase